MKWSFATVGLIIMGLFGIMIIMLFHEITVSNEQDYYTLKDATEAAMIDAIDTAYYRLTGQIKISEEKFVENFTRRFTETSIFGQGNYNIEFYQITEYPAKVSIRIRDATNSYDIYNMFDVSLNSTQTNIVNELSAILDGYELSDIYDEYEDIQELGPCEQQRTINCNITLSDEIQNIILTDRPSQLYDFNEDKCYVYVEDANSDGKRYYYEPIIKCNPNYHYDKNKKLCVCN